MVVVVVVFVALVDKVDAAIAIADAIAVLVAVAVSHHRHAAARQFLHTRAFCLLWSSFNVSVTIASDRVCRWIDPLRTRSATHDTTVVVVVVVVASAVVGMGNDVAINVVIDDDVDVVVACVATFNNGYVNHNMHVLNNINGNASKLRSLHLLLLLLLSIQLLLLLSLLLLLLLLSLLILLLLLLELLRSLSLLQFLLLLSLLHMVLSRLACRACLRDERRHRRAAHAPHQWRLRLAKFRGLAVGAATTTGDGGVDGDRWDGSGGVDDNPFVAVDVVALDRATDGARDVCHVGLVAPLQT